MSFHRFFAFSLMAGSLWAQGNTQAGLVRGLNNEILQLHSRAQRAAPAAAAQIRAEASPVLERRAAALEALVRENPAAALSLAFSPEVLSQLVRTFPQRAGLLEAHGTWQGPVDYVVIDDDSMTRHWTRVQIQHGNESLDVHFAQGEPPGLKCNDMLRVNGVKAGSSVAAADSMVEAAALTCSTTGEQRTAVLLVTFPGVAPPGNVTRTGVRDIFFGPAGRSVDGFWREASYGRTWATGDVFGWYTVDRIYTCDEYTKMGDAAIRAADADIDFRLYTRIFIVFPPQGSCGWAGVANLGCRSLSSPGDGTFQASRAWLVSGYMANRDQGVMLATHEGGHNLTLGHATSRRFPNEVLGPLGTAGTISEYGDQFSTMGSWNLGQYGAQHKLRMNWLVAGQNIQTVESSGVFTLQPIEVSPSGLQALKVRRGTGNNAWLWVEYRQPIGPYDSALPKQVHSGALIRYEDSNTSKTQILDFTPETSSWSDPALVQGRSWTDPYSNVALTVTSATANALTVGVMYGASPCTPANPTVSLNPPNPSVYAGSSASYTVTVTNNDSAGCASSTFALASAAPAGWPSSLSVSALTLNPGQSGSVMLTKTPPVGTAPATYALEVAATDGNRSGSGPANCTVMDPPPPLSAILAPNGAVFPVRTSVPISATVLSGANPAQGATVRFSVARSKGAASTQTATTGATGQAVWEFKANQKDTYTVKAEITFGSQTISAAPVTFTLE